MFTPSPYFHLGPLCPSFNKETVVLQLKFKTRGPVLTSLGQLIKPHDMIKY